MHCQTPTLVMPPFQPTWITQHHIKKIPPQAQSWLMTTGSLSNRIRKISTTFTIERLGLEQKGYWKGQDVERFSPQQQVVKRCVFLKSGGVPWIYAQSYFPASLWEQHFSNLNQHSLGDILFKTYQCWRSCLKIGDFRQALQGCTHLIERDLLPTDPTQPCLGRRSWFYFRTQSIMIDEVFLPQSPVFFTQKESGQS